MPAKKLEKLLQSGSGGNLEKLIQTAQNMDSLTGALRGALTPELADHVLAANVRANSELVVICSSSAWASRVRFEADVLLVAAAEAGFNASSLRVAVTQN